MLNFLFRMFSQHQYRLLKVSVLLLCGALFAACSSNKGIDLSRTSEQSLYQQAQKNLERGNFLDAIDILQSMEKVYPFGEYSKSAQLSLIYAHYGYSEPAAADAAADRFIRLHPQYRHVDYAYYMKGLISFPKAKTYFQRALNVDMSKRDVLEARRSFSQFSRLSKRFPSSEYTPDALKRMQFLRNLLARHEIHVANYYFEREAYLAATNRGKYVVENFQTTPAVPDALAVMAQGYYEMGMNTLSENSVRTLRSNYPNHPALNSDGSFDFGYNSRRLSSVLDFATLGLLGSSRPPGFNSEKLYNPTDITDTSAALSTQPKKADSKK